MRSEERAEERLEEMLETGFDPVPCPKCGDYSPEMAEVVKNERYQPLLRHQTQLLIGAAISGAFGAMFLFAAVLSTGLPNPTSPETLLVLGCGLTVVVCVGKWGWNQWSYVSRTAAYDPNDPVLKPERLAEAKRIATLEYGDQSQPSSFA